MVNIPHKIYKYDHRYFICVSKFYEYQNYMSNEYIK